MTDTCKGPGQAKGEKCPRKAVAHGWCNSHRYQIRQAGGDESAVKPLLGPHGRKYEDAVRLELRNVHPEVVATFAALGERVPPTDKREKELGHRGARYLVAAFAAGGAKLKASHHPAKVAVTNTLPPRGAAHSRRVDLRHVPKAEADALATLGALIPPAYEGDKNLALRGCRYLIQAFHEGGVRFLASHAPKDLTPARQSA